MRLCGTPPCETDNVEKHFSPYFPLTSQWGGKGGSVFSYVVLL